MSFNYKDNKVDWIFSLEEFNKLGWFGDQNTHLIQFVCSDGINYYIGLPFLQDIIVLDRFKKEISREVFSSTKIKTIKPIATSRINITPDKQIMHLRASGSYFEFIYDQYQSRFYRRLFAPNTEAKNSKEVYDNQYLLVSDKQFQSIHEYKIPQKYRSLIWFSSPFGLCMCDKESYDRDENNLVFDCFKFK